MKNRNGKAIPTNVDTYLSDVILKISRVASNEFGSTLSENELIFSEDSKIDYSSREVKRENAIDIHLFRESLPQLLFGGPSWIHFNLFKKNDGPWIVSVLRGGLVGNPHPSINLSWENKPIKIVD